MLHPVPRKDLDMPIVHEDGKTDGEGALWELQAFTEIGIQVHRFCGLIKL